MNMRWLWLVPFLFSLPARAMDLREYMDQVVKKHRGLEAMRLSAQAAEDKRQAGDLELSPQLSLGGSYLSDKKQPSQVGAQEMRVDQYSASLAKKFSTGTAVKLSANTTTSKYLGLNPAFVNILGGEQFGTGGLGLSISQSLWKDGFGHGTRLRQAREAAIAEAESGNYDLQSRQILSDAEKAFWDYLYRQQEVAIRKASLERADRIDKWISRRVSDGISDRADQLNAKALVASRKLQLDMAEDGLTGAEKTLRDYLELAPGEALPPVQGRIGERRDLKKLVGEGGGRVVKLDAWIAQLQAKASESGAKEVANAVAADLALSGAYNTNSYAPGGTASDATKDISKTDLPTVTVGLTWTYTFDTDAKTSRVEEARKQALAAKLQAERKSREGDTAWSELLRRDGELTKQITASEEISKLQSERAKAQQNKLSRGRAITIDVINSEQEAAEAELQWARLQVEQRKLESQSRLYIAVKE
ncbi:MAG: TolC family protein [Bdellovibrionaceae bacterium]|nr:TolC family protein [Pseudobdellovibrionaceae bacterium]